MPERRSCRAAGYDENPLIWGWCRRHGDYGGLFSGVHAGLRGHEAIMHCLAMKLGTALRRSLAARRHRAMVALAIVEMMIDMSVEMIPSVIPGTRTDENSAREPLRTIVAVGRTAIRGALVVPIWTNRR